MPHDAPATPAVTTSSTRSLAILRSLRRILRRVELASNELESSHGITSPQLLCLRAIVQHGQRTQVELSRDVHLSASTLVGVLDRLEAKGLVTRTRDRVDRRRIYIAATPAGIERDRQAPEPLHTHLERQLHALAERHQTTIANALDKLVVLLEAQDVDTSPLLTSGPIPKPQDLEGRGR